MVAVLAAALIVVRRGLERISEGLATLGRRARGRRGGAPAPARGRRQGDQRAVRRHPRRAAGDRAQGRDRGRAEAAMTLWWIGDVVLLVVRPPGRRLPAERRAEAAQSIVPSVQQIATAAAAGSKDLDAARAAADDAGPGRPRPSRASPNYGGSLDVILDDADRSAMPYSPFAQPAWSLIVAVAPDRRSRSSSTSSRRSSRCARSPPASTR